MPYVMCVASVACNFLGVFDDNPSLSSPAIKVYSYLYLALMIIFQEITVRRLMGEYREALVHYDRSQTLKSENPGKFEIKLQTVMNAAP